MVRVQIAGIDELKKEEEFQFNKIVNHYYDKVERAIKNDFTLNIKVKHYQRPESNDKNRKVSIQVQVMTSTRKLDATADDWDLNKTLHGVFKNLLNEIEHRFRVSDKKS